MFDLGPAGYAIIGFIAAVGGVTGVFALTRFRVPCQ